TDADLALLGDVDADAFPHAGLQFVRIFRGEDLDIHNDAVLAMRNAQRGIAHFTSLLAEDCTEQPFFGGELGFTLRGNLADKDIAGLDLCANPDDATLVKILERVVADVRNVAGNLL